MNRSNILARLPSTWPRGNCYTKAVGVCHQSPMKHIEREREREKKKKSTVTKREFLNNLSNIYTFAV